MKWYWKVIIILLIIILVFVAVSYLVIRSASVPSKGEKIMTYSMPKKALLIIDMQEDFIGEKSSMKDRYPYRERVINFINNIQADAQKRGVEIIYIRQEYSGFLNSMMSHVYLKGSALKDSPGAQLDKRINVLSKNDFVKSKGDAFYNKALNDFLVSNSINELFITGLDGQYCVHSTIKGALQRGYKVHAISDAILVGNMDNWDLLFKEYQKEGVEVRKSYKSIF